MWECPVAAYMSKIFFKEPLLISSCLQLEMRRGSKSLRNKCIWSGLHVQICVCTLWKAGFKTPILIAQFIFCCRMYFHALGSDAERLVEVVARLAPYAAAEAVGQVFLTESHVAANLPVHCSVFIFKLHIFTAEVPVYSFSYWKEDTATLPKPRHTLFC